MKIYKDSSLTEEINTLDFGIVMAGENKSFEFFVYNDSKANLVNLSISIDNKEVEILKFPKELKSGEKSSLVVRWSPSVTLKEGLKSELKIDGYEIYGG